MNFDPLAITTLPWHGDGDGGPAGQPEPAEKQSIWKRELSFRRHGAEGEPVEAAEPIEAEAEPVQPVEPAEVVGASDPGDGDFPRAVAALYSSWEALGIEQRPAAPEPEAKASMWKRELSFGRRKGDDEPQPPAEPETALAGGWEPASEPELEAAAEQELEAKPSIWKRELSFGRSRKAEPAEAGEPEPDSLPEELEPAAVEAWEPEPEAKPSIWKRELSFGRSRKGETAEAGEPEPEPDSLPEELPPAAEETWMEEPVAQPETLEPVAAEAWEPEPEPEFELEPEPAAVQAWEPEPEVEPEPAADGPLNIWEELGLSQPGAEASSETEELEADEADEPEQPRKRRGSRLGFRRRRAGATADPSPSPDAEPERAPRSSRKRGGSKRSVKIVGLKLGASQIAAAHVRTNGSIEVLKTARMPLEKGVIVGGEVRDPDLLATALRTFFKANKLPRRGVRLGIASNRIGVRTLDVVGVDDPALLPNAIRFRAQEVLPIPLTDAVLDYRVLGEEVDEEGQVHRRVLVVFAYRELVDRYLAACRTAGVRLQGIDLEGFALLRALVDPAESGSRPAGAAVVTAAIGHDRSILSVSDGTVCEFTRVIEWGGGVLDTAVARILALTPSQAEPIKRGLTLDPGVQTPEGLNAEQATRARNAMLHEVNAFARELISSLQFYQAQPGSLDIGEIIVTGGAAHMRGLVEELQRLTGVGVRLGDPLVRVSGARNLAGDEQLGSLALAIGLGIED